MNKGWIWDMIREGIKVIQNLSENIYQKEQRNKTTEHN